MFDAHRVDDIDVHLSFNASLTANNEFDRKQTKKKYQTVL